MGVLDFIAAGYLAKRAHNVANKPHVTVPDGIEILSLKAKGMNEYVIKYRTKGSSTKSQMTISRSKRFMSGGWEFHWDRPSFIQTRRHRYPLLKLVPQPSHHSIGYWPQRE